MPAIDGIVQYAVNQTHRRRHGAWPAPHCGAASGSFGLDEGFGLTRHDIAHGFRDDGLSEVFDPAGSEERDDVPFDPAQIDVDGRLLLRAAPFAQNESIPEILHVELA